MGHAVHFLERLDRLSNQHVELALSLYHDAELVKTLLGAARIADSAERVAISLDDPEAGPFVIVTRGGDFVTCLAEGMRPGDLPILRRERLEGATTKLEVWRERRQEAERLAGPGTRTKKLLLRIY